MRFLKALLARIGQNDFPGLSAEMAYNWMMALLPLLVFLFTLFGLFAGQGDEFHQIMENLRRLVPQDAYALVADTLEDLTSNSSTELAIIGFLGTLWASSNGAMVVIKGLDRAYRCTEENRNVILQRTIALGIVVGMGLILLVGSNLLVFGGMIISVIEARFSPDGLVVFLLEVVRWVLPLAGLIPVSMFIYIITPNRPKRGAWKEVWPGALTFVGLWVIISWLFSLYVSNMANYSKVYGSMGAIVILLFWLYLSSFALLIGGQVNAMRSGCDEGELNAPPSPNAS
ncbi:MAG TPA: YihY/virulence factor BrkB family protein [Coleofasciculaceae cyanobacterium]|jgi:membrane protein